jgi:hypothetical protein
MPLEPINEYGKMEPQVTLLTTAAATGSPAYLVEAVRHALDKAIAGETKLSPEVLGMVGMSGRKYRSFVNNLIGQLSVPRYLEIGSWRGSTLCSAIFGNDVEAVAIDNWSLGGGPFDAFLTNLAAFKGSARVSFLERDFRKVDYASLRGIFGPVGVYLFDGPHEFKDQYDGVVCAQPIVEPRYVQIVDDWNWPDVRGGTMKAISDLGLHIEFMAEIRTSLDDKHALAPISEKSDWHNGYCISVLSRSS